MNYVDCCLSLKSGRFRDMDGATVKCSRPSNIIISLFLTFHQRNAAKFFMRSLLPVGIPLQIELFFWLLWDCVYDWNCGLSYL